MLMHFLMKHFQHCGAKMITERATSYLRSIFTICIAISISISSGNCWAAPNWQNIREGCVGTDERYIEKCMLGLLEDEPLHLSPSNIVDPGGGAYAFVLQHTSQFQTNDNVSLNKLITDFAITNTNFWKVGADYKYAQYDENNPTVLSPIDVNVSYRSLYRLDFYGLGPNTTHNASTYKATEFVSDVGYIHKEYDWLTVVGHVGFDSWSFPVINDADSMRVQYTEATAPGIDRQLDFLRFVISAKYSNCSEDQSVCTGSNSVTLTEVIYQDLSGGKYSFSGTTLLWDLSTPLDDAGGLISGTIDFRAQINSLTSWGGAIPFYLQPTLGGIDSQGQETLRGFVDYRFRGSSLALAQLEYDHRLFSSNHLHHGFIFLDVGQVASSEHQLLQFEQLRHDYGLGYAAFFGNKKVLRAYLAFGSGEGALMKWDFTKPF